MSYTKSIMDTDANKMKFLTFIFALLFLVTAGGFLAFAFMDVPLNKTVVTKTISNDRFFSADS